ncbi:MAG TPA: hypothetical protein VND19_04055 [Acetobacteraceae bacterium]|nr:hypothetical protein [Acetobacteraceae bacterium]
MDRRTIGLIWIGGIVLMVVLYVIGPQDFIQACEAYLSRLWWFIGNLIETLSARAFNAVRAAALALYAVFAVLAVLARRRGLRGGGALFIVSALFLLLVGTRWYDPGIKWFTAAVLAGAGAAAMTARLLHPPPLPRDPNNPWGASGYRPVNQPGAPPPP